MSCSAGGHWVQVCKVESFIPEVHTVLISIPTHTVLSRYMYDTRRVKLLTYHRPPAIFPHSFSFHCPFPSCPSYP